jgi:hypothetical protein
MDCLFSGPPEPAADPVLALCDDLDAPVAVGDGLLEALLEDPGIDTGPFLRTRNNDRRFAGHHISL